MEDMKDNKPLEQNEAANQKDKKKKRIDLVIVAILSVALVAVAIVGAVFLVGRCGVDTSVATPDEAATSDETTAFDTTVSQSTSVSNTETEPTTPDGKVYNIKQDWDELASINDEIKAWINIPGTTVNYPVLKHAGDGYQSQYYLHRNFDKSYLFAGSIFIDYRSYSGVNSKNIVTHGHNMNDGSMYGALLNYGKYSGNLSYYKSHPTLFFNTPAGNEQWVIFSVFKTNTLNSHGEFFNYLVGDFSSDAQFMNFIYNVKERSLFDIPVPINENDQIITLSTCSYEYTDFRTVVMARKIRPGESVGSYVNSASLNPNPVWPDVHGTNVSITTFKTEYQKGNTPWYDGSGELSGTEWLVGASGNKSYTVSFLDYNGEILTTQTVERGHDAIPPAPPERPEDKYYTYEFKEWQLDYTDVDCNMAIAPSYTATLKPIEDRW